MIDKILSQITLNILFSNQINFKNPKNPEFSMPKMSQWYAITLSE